MRPPTTPCPSSSDNDGRKGENEADEDADDDADDGNDDADVTSALATPPLPPKFPSAAALALWVVLSRLLDRC